MAKTTKATKAAPPPDIEVVDGPVNEEHALVSEDTGKLRTFMGGMVPFFQRAGELERAAKERLDVARQMQTKYLRTLPADADEDLKIQNELLASKRERKVIDETWGITQVMSQLHKRLVAGRERAGKMLDEAATIYQDIHNRYAREQQRIADEENRRRRIEEEQRETARRAREQEELEAAAVKREAEMEGLSEREQRFVELVANGFNGPSTAARTSGYKDAEKAGERLMATPKIIAAIDALRDAAAIRQQAKAKTEEPLVVDTPTVRANVTKAAGSRSVTTKSAAVDDADAFLAAVLDPKTRATLGIPTDCLIIDEAKLNQHARNLGDIINRWPGVRLVTKTSTS